jgi:hypothetical protein
MKFIVSIHGYDVMNEVVATARVRQYKDYEQDEGELVLAQAVAFPGVGEDDPAPWLAALLEALLGGL